MLRRLVVAVAAVVSMAAVTATAAGACGGLVGENGTIELVRTTTLAAYSDGIERYVTAFEFTGEGKEVGSIIPLPDVPTKVERGGDWTLQRLVQEVAPPAEENFAADGAPSPAAARLEVILEVEIDALDITVLKGGGDEVGEWAVDHGFFLTPDAPEMLDYYAERSPVFMAARFNAERADDLGQGAGDSTPIMATIPTDNPWVPIRILGLGAEADRTIEADVFLLTEDEPTLMAGGTGMTLARSERANSFLLDELRSDKAMEWVPADMWLSYLTVGSPAGELDYDLAISTNPTVQPSLTDAGVDEAQAIPIGTSTDGLPTWPLLLGVGAGLATLALGRFRPVRDRNPGLRGDPR